MNSLDGCLEQIDVKVPRSAVHRNGNKNIASYLIYAAIKEHHNKHPDDLPGWLIKHPALSEPDMVALIEEGAVDREQLGHWPGPVRLLLVLADHFCYDEAILTIGKQYYTDPGVSTDEFLSFFKRHQDNRWLLESLAREDASSHQKHLIYSETLTKYPDIQNNVINIRLSRQRQNEASAATLESEIRKLYETGDFAVMRALAANPHTPTDLLRCMESLHGVKFAREIRNRARDTLARERRQ